MRGQDMVARRRRYIRQTEEGLERLCREGISRGLFPEAQTVDAKALSARPGRRPREKSIERAALGAAAIGLLALGAVALGVPVAVLAFAG